MKLSRYSEDRTLLVCTLNEVKRWVESYDKEPEKFREYMLNLLEQFELDVDAVCQNIFYETAQKTYLFPFKKN